MKCPNCSTTNLVMSERQGIEIDYCPSCRGIWLDRGEMDKLIEKAVMYDEGSHPPHQSRSQTRFNPYGHGRGGKHWVRVISSILGTLSTSFGYRRRKKHWLHDLLD